MYNSLSFIRTLKNLILISFVSIYVTRLTHTHTHARGRARTHTTHIMYAYMPCIDITAIGKLRVGLAPNKSHQLHATSEQLRVIDRNNRTPTRSRSADGIHIRWTTITRRGLFRSI